MVYIILIAYLSITFLSSLIGKKENSKSPEAYFLAGRNINTIVLIFTLAATTFSAFFFLGFAGDGYRYGFPFYAFMSFGTAFAALSFYLVGNPAWRLGKMRGYITPVELIEDITKHKWLARTYLFVFLIFTFPYIALQPIGAGYIMEELTNGAIPFIWGAGILTGFIIIYVFLGGMQSVAQTDVKQGILMFILMVSATLLITIKSGGLETGLNRVRAIKPELFIHQGPDQYMTYKKWFSMNLLWFFCLPMLPHIFMRFFISKSLKGFKTSTFIYAMIPAVFFILPVLIGILGHLDFPDLEAKEADRILPMMLGIHAPEWFTALILVGALAAFMSTLDSQLLALGTIFTRDVYLKYINPNAGLSKQVQIGKISVIGFALIGLLLAANPVESLFILGQQTFFGLAVLFPPTIAVLYFKSTNYMSCIFAILTGELLVILNFLELLPDGWTMGFSSFLPILFLETILIITMSVFFTKTVNKE